MPIFDNEDGTVSGVLSNNGHAPTVTLDKTQGGVTLTAGPLGQNTFRLEQFRFHFGCESNVGSEHTVDGNSFASEVSNMINAKAARIKDPHEKITISKQRNESCKTSFKRTIVKLEEKKGVFSLRLIHSPEGCPAYNQNDSPLV